MVSDSILESILSSSSASLAQFKSSQIGYKIDWSRLLTRDAIQYDPKQQQINLHINIGFACQSMIPILEQELCSHLTSHISAELTASLSLNQRSPFQVRLTQSIEDAKQLSATPRIEGIKHIIAVASGKGGVGKSTTAVNLAVALSQEGAAVGLLDADIYGPSQQMMLGLREQDRPELLGQQRWKPIHVHGIEAMSMAFMITDRTPMLWRGPMVSGALLQLLNNTQWPELDYLIVDMPPGTGDIQLTMVQKVPITGALIVTTPQDIALLDAKKGVEMFRRVGVPILGVVENMSTHRCSQCGHEEPIFGEGGGTLIAEQYETTLLGRLPLTLAIREQADSGLPIVIKATESAEAKQYRAIARAASASLWSQLDSVELPDIEILED